MIDGVDYSVVDFEYVDIFILNNVQSVLISDNEDYMNSVRNYFTDKVKNSQFMKNVKAGLWDGKIRHVSFDGRFPVGLIPELTSKLDDWDIKYRIHDNTNNPNDINVDLFDMVIENEMISKQEKPLKPWDHQVNIAKTLIKNRRGIARAATSAGKTYTMAMLCKYLLVTKYVSKILIIVPKSDLTVQGKRDLEEFGFEPKDVGMFFGAVKDTENPIVISTWQSLQNLEDKSFFESFDMVIGDEIHLAGQGSTTTKSQGNKGGTIFKRCIDKCINASFRYGLTGTMPKDRLNQRTIKGCLGEVLIDVSARELMDKKKVSDLKVVLSLLNYDKKLVNKELKKFKENYDKDSSTAGYNAEKDFIQSYVPRYRFITKIVNKCLKEDENILVLATTVEYGKKLKKAIEHKCKDATRIEHIYGEMNVNERQKIIKYMEENTGVVVVATTSLFSTGISVKNLHSVVFANMNKAYSQCIQSVGRILRLHKTKKVAKVFDLIDNGLKYSRQHGAQRVEYYDADQFDTVIIEKDI